MDPTGRKAAKEEVERRLPLKMQIFLRLRQELRHYRGRQGWTVAMQRRYAQVLAKRTGKGEEECWIEDHTTFWRWWIRIVEYTARLAAKAGLLD